jgi:hypothetical protein
MQSVKFVGEPAKLAYSIAAAAECFEPPIHKRIIYRALRSGELKVHRVAGPTGRAYISLTDLLEWINRS